MKKIAIILLVFSLPIFADEPFHQEGSASWYGTEFDGQNTASGEIFDSSLYTAAHPTLPFGTLVIVTRQDNNKKVIVRINDRGPFISERIIDVSKAAAEYLDMITVGTIKVVVDKAPDKSNTGPLATTSDTESSAGTLASAVPASSEENEEPLDLPSVPAIQNPQPSSPSSFPLIAPEALGPAVQVQPTDSPTLIRVVPDSEGTPVVVAPAPVVVPEASPVVVVPEVKTPKRTIKLKPSTAPSAGNKRYTLQVGAFKQPKNAVATFDKVKAAGLKPDYGDRKDGIYRVVLKGIRASEFDTILDKLEKAGFEEVVWREEP